MQDESPHDRARPPVSSGVPASPPDESRSTLTRRLISQLSIVAVLAGLLTILAIAAVLLSTASVNEWQASAVAVGVVASGAIAIITILITRLLLKPSIRSAAAATARKLARQPAVTYSRDITSVADYEMAPAEPPQDATQTAAEYVVTVPRRSSYWVAFGCTVVAILVSSANFLFMLNSGRGSLAFSVVYPASAAFIAMLAGIWVLLLRTKRLADVRLNLLRLNDAASEDGYLTADAIDRLKEQRNALVQSGDVADAKAYDALIGELRDSQYTLRRRGPSVAAMERD